MASRQLALRPRGRLQHAEPYQHLLPGMGAAAATRFAALVDAARQTSTVSPVANPQVSDLRPQATVEHSALRSAMANGGRATVRSPTAVLGNRVSGPAIGNTGWVPDFLLRSASVAIQDGEMRRGMRWSAGTTEL